MNRFVVFLISIFFCWNNLLIAQESKWSLGIQGGRTQLLGNTGVSFEQIPEFEAQGMGGVNLQLYGRIHIHKRVSLFASGGINNLVSGMRFQGKRGNNFGTRGVTPQYFVGLDYDLPFGSSGFGLISRLAYGITGSNARDKHLREFIIEDGDFPLIGWQIQDNLTGQVEDRRIFLRQVQLFASDYKFIYHFRPELSIYRRFGPHQISVSSVFALAPDRNYYREEYIHLDLKGNRHTAFHQFGGHYTALLLGYEFRF